jgi:hypothetical protein
VESARLQLRNECVGFDVQARLGWVLLGLNYERFFDLTFRPFFVVTGAITALGSLNAFRPFWAFWTGAGMDSARVLFGVVCFGAYDFRASPEMSRN